jgi:signal transduction histidine kinase
MTPHVFHYLASLFLTSATTLGLGLFVIFYPQSRSLHKIFGLYSLAISAWSFFQALFTFPENELFAVWITKTIHITILFIPALFFHFIWKLLRRRSLKPIVLLNYVICVAFLLFLPSPWFIRGVIARDYLKSSYTHGFFTDPGPLYLWHVVWFVTIATVGLILLFRETLLTNGPRKNQLWYLTIGTLLGYLGGLPNYAYSFDHPIPIINPYGTYAVPIYVAMTAYAIVRHKLLDIRIVFRRSAVYSLLIACITAMYLVTVLIMERLFQGFFGYRSIFATIIVAFFIAIFFNPLRNRIQAFVDRALFKATPVELAAQREQLLVEVRRGDQMKAVATLAAGLAHEIKNPLASIKTFTDYLNTRYTDPEFRAKFQKIVGGEVERINLIVQQLLEFAKPVPPKLAPLDVSQVVDETLDFLNSELVQRHVDVKRQYETTVRILGDPHQLKQVFLNLFLNSMQATNGHGQLDVHTAERGDELVVTIADNGSGISPKDLPHIFEPFFTTKTNGTGLGLAVVQGIIKEHGGRIAVESYPGQGTRFALSLPIAVMVE